MTSADRFHVRIENNCLFIDDSESGGVTLQQNAHPGLRPNIHPLRGPDGITCLTQDSPYHHPWQHGVTTGFHGVNGCDFWYDRGQRAGVAIGTITPTAPRIVSADAPKWTVEAIWAGEDGRFLLAEEQTWTLQQAGDVLYLDMAWRMQSIRDVHIEQQKYGGLFISMPYEKERGGEVVNSAGQTEDSCEQQRAQWVDIFLPVARSENGGGITMCDHPGNPGHPAHWRLDGNRGINPSPCIPGPVEMPSGTSMNFHYRLILHLGKLAPETVQEHYDLYAAGDPG
ncbi:MAG: hypothetical protein HN368_08070 [Spirochaetales bacterium]|jgi:hypothetical protein|nr:hypothetical protein [Spirochaetales bacterium]